MVISASLSPPVYFSVHRHHRLPSPRRINKITRHIIHTTCSSTKRRKQVEDHVACLSDACHGTSVPGQEYKAFSTTEWQSYRTGRLASPTLGMYTYYDGVCIMGMCCTPCGVVWRAMVFFQHLPCPSLHTLSWPGFTCYCGVTQTVGSLNQRLFFACRGIYGQPFESGRPHPCQRAASTSTCGVDCRVFLDKGQTRS